VNTGKNEDFAEEKTSSGRQKSSQQADNHVTVRPPTLISGAQYTGTSIAHLSVKTRSL
jgi:hypothetical protein